GVQIVQYLQHLLGPAQHFFFGLPPVLFYQLPEILSLQILEKQIVAPAFHEVIFDFGNLRMTELRQKLRLAGEQLRSFFPRLLVCAGRNDGFFQDNKVPTVSLRQIYGRQPSEGKLSNDFQAPALQNPTGLERNEVGGAETPAQLFLPHLCIAELLNALVFTEKHV